MDQTQLETILHAIAVSSLHLPEFTPTDHQAAFKILEDFKRFDGRVTICITLLHEQRHTYNNIHDITIATKLLALEILDNFLITGYSKCTENDRITLRNAVLKAARMLAMESSNNSVVESRILARKLAVLLKGLLLRDFPQRWMTLGNDLFAGLSQGGLWIDETYPNNTNGVKICLECLKQVAEDCTDSDFNSKISTSRRNDVLIGLNEICNIFLPLLFQLLEKYYPLLQQSKITVYNMHKYLLTENRTISTMNADESTAYRKERAIQSENALMIADTLMTLVKFCATLPVNWILGDNNSNNNSDNNVPNIDFVAAFLHLLREPDEHIQVKAMDCLEQLVLRGKLTFQQWIRFITEVPLAFQDANQLYTSTEQEYRIMESRATGNDYDDNNNTIDPLTAQLDFHRGLSRLLACIISSHISHITNSKGILSGNGQYYDKLHIFLRLMVDMLHHPSGRILSEQITMWTNLFRDQQIAKSIILEPFCGEIMTSYMDHMIRIRWDDIENETHPQTKLIETSFDDEDEYDIWMMDIRSKASQLFKYIGNMSPKISSQVLNTRIQTLILNYGNGGTPPLSYLDNTNNQLTQKSDAVIQFEAIFQPLDNTLSGMQSWAMMTAVETATNNVKQQYDQNDEKRMQIRIATRTALSEMATALVNWKPTYLWLKFRHASLLEPLKYYWKHDPTTLLQGVDTLIRYLGLPDEWVGATTMNNNNGVNNNLSGEIVSLKKKSGVALVAVAKKVPHHLVPWLTQLSDATRSLLSSHGLIPTNQMHLYEFLSCVATAVENPIERSNFIADVLADAVNVLDTPDIQNSIQTTTTLLNALGITNARDKPNSVTDITNVNTVSNFYYTIFIPLNRLLSVGRRCSEAAKKRSVIGGIPVENLPPINTGFGEPGQPQFPPDEGPLSIQDLAFHDPFAPLWPRILPTLLQLYESLLGIWRPENQAILLQNEYQRYAYAISDDEAYLAQNQSQKSGGVFGEGGTAGSVVSGTDRREKNLVPKWSAWFNELRNTCFQLLGLLAIQRVLYSPEIAPWYPRIVTALTDSLNLKSMEHRHIVQFMKHVLEMLFLSCPCSLYKTHLEPIVGPILDHIRFRLDKTWIPIISGDQASVNGLVGIKALNSVDCATAAQLANRGGDDWFMWYYAHAGLFVGDLDTVTSEAVVEKNRVDLGRSFSDILQTIFALKGDWALVLANQAKEEQAARKNDSSILSSGPTTRCTTDEGTALNADGTPKLKHQEAIDARKLLRINGLCHFLLLESESIAGNITMTVIQCMSYPDAYTCRRIVKICHRILETVAWLPQYSQLLGQHMFTQAVKNLVTEPKWMVGVEWDMIAVVRDIYGRLVLGQILQAGGQGIGQQQPDGKDGNRYEQAKSVDAPLQGGGILVNPSNLPRQILASLPGVGEEGVREFERSMTEKRSAKAQKDCIRDLLRIVADKMNEMYPNNTIDYSNAAAGLFDRAVAEESLLHASSRPKVVEDIPEKLITKSQLNKATKMNNEQPPEGMGAFKLFT